MIMAVLQSPMPGQAVMPQMTAPKSAATPAAEVGQYEPGSSGFASGVQGGLLTGGLYDILFGKK